MEAPFLVVLSNGDRAEADDPEAAIVAARTMVDDLPSVFGRSKVTASFYNEGVLVRADVRQSEMVA